MSNVKSPPHYNRGKIEVITFIEDQKLGFCLGNAIKYLCRAGIKDSSLEKHCEDLEKAIWYIKRELEPLKEERSKELKTLRLPEEARTKTVNTMGRNLEYTDQGQTVIETLPGGSKMAYPIDYFPSTEDAIAHEKVRPVSTKIGENGPLFR